MLNFFPHILIILSMHLLFSMTRDKLTSDYSKVTESCIHLGRKPAKANSSGTSTYCASIITVEPRTLWEQKFCPLFRGCPLVGANMQLIAPSCKT